MAEIFCTAPRSPVRRVFPGRASAVARGAVGEGTRRRRAPASVSSAGASMRTTCFAAAMVVTVVLSEMGASLAVWARVCNAARRRGCSSKTEVTAGTTVSFGGGARPTGFMVRPVVRGVSNGGAERWRLSERTLMGARPRAGSPASRRSWAKALLPERSRALASSRVLVVALAANAARLSAAAPQTRRPLRSISDAKGSGRLSPVSTSLLIGMMAVLLPYWTSPVTLSPASTGTVRAAAGTWSGG